MTALRRPGRQRNLTPPTTDQDLISPLAGAVPKALIGGGDQVVECIHLAQPSLWCGTATVTGHLRPLTP